MGQTDHARPRHRARQAGRWHGADALSPCRRSLRATRFGGDQRRRTLRRAAARRRRVDDGALPAGVRRWRRISGRAACSCPIRRSSTRSYSTSASPTRRRTTTCRCSSRRGAIRRIAAARPFAPSAGSGQALSLSKGNCMEAYAQRLGAAHPALGAPDHRHRLDRRLVLLRLARQQPAAAARPGRRRQGDRRRAVGGARRRLLRTCRSSASRPRSLPEPLHWFKWEAYWTWISGFALLVVMYYLHARRVSHRPQRGRPRAMAGDRRSAWR